MKAIEFFIGYDGRLPEGYAVAARSLVKMGADPLSIHPLVLPHLQGTGLYDRPMHESAGQLHDAISGAPMATEFAISRFLVPHLACSHWAIFCDSDFLFRKPILPALEAVLDDRFALMCVQHEYAPTEAVKMQGQAQTLYNRKNWSSFMAFNTRHPANDALTLDMIKTLPGRDLHRFCWLADDEIGALPDSFNWLEGHSTSPDPGVVHFTRGTPDMAGYENVPFADEWRAVLAEVSLCKREN